MSTPEQDDLHKDLRTALAELLDTLNLDLSGWVYALDRTRTREAYQRAREALARANEEAKET